MNTITNAPIVDAERVVKSPEFLNAMRTVASCIKWGTIVTEIKDGILVMVRIQKDIKLS